MTPAAPETELAGEYSFRFDLPLEPVIFGGEVDLSGWLLHREGKPIHGIRAVVKRPFFRREILRGRRKRKRPDVAAAFPNLPEAEASGFLLELRLRLGRSRLAFQVLDHERIWQTFATGSVFSLPLAILTWSGLPNVRRFFIFYLKQFFARKRSAANVPSPVASAETLRLPVQTSATPLSTRRVELFATSKSNLFIIEIGELVAAGFRELGCEAQLHLNGIPEDYPAKDTLQIVVTPHEYYNLFLSEKLPRHVIRRLTYNTYLLCTEQPETGWFQSNLQWGVYARGMADINALGVAAYRARGLNAYQLHLGYHPVLAREPRTSHPERRLDITFLGSMTERRDLFFAEHADFFARHRCHLRLVPLGFAKTKDTRSYLTVERRNELLSQSRILLNVHYSEQKYFEWHRMLVGIANGCCIITETCQGYASLVPGKHFIMVEPEYLIPCCEYYLAHPEECERIALAGLHFVETELRQAQMCRAFLTEIEAAAERDGDDAGQTMIPLAPTADAHPAPLPSEILEKISHETRRLLLRALKRDLRGAVNNFANRRKKKPALVAEGSSQNRERKSEVIKKRKAYQERLQKQEEDRARGEAVWRFHDNAAVAHCTEPKLSVLITLYNYAQHIEECVASITAAAQKLPQPPEIVIVNDASTDESLARAFHCQRKSALPIRVVDKRFNTGLADARNTALEVARAPYVFIMDADNLIFPEGLKQLLDVISADNYAAAYSLLCRFRDHPGNRVGLLSYFDWDPQILAQYPYIDAMAMFSRQALLDLGGYDNQLSQIGWFGWEDYDMWLRFALHDLPVAFVPNTLCLYRHHDSSMINTTNLFESALVHHLIEQYGELLDRFEPRAKVFGVDREKIAELRNGRRPEKARSIAL
ncbi:MAG: glycosyltransferase [Chthoniobacterales bacterium]